MKYKQISIKEAADRCRNGEAVYAARCIDGMSFREVTAATMLRFQANKSLYQLIPDRNLLFSYDVPHTLLPPLRIKGKTLYLNL